jgi:hypothetical protein
VLWFFFFFFLFPLFIGSQDGPEVAGFFHYSKDNYSEGPFLLLFFVV